MSVSNVTGSSFALSWNAPSIVFKGSLVGYHIYIADHPSNSIPPLTSSAPDTTTLNPSFPTDYSLYQTVSNSPLEINVQICPLCSYQIQIIPYSDRGNGLPLDSNITVSTLDGMNMIYEDSGSSILATYTDDTASIYSTSSECSLSDHFPYLASNAFGTGATCSYLSTSSFEIVMTSVNPIIVPRSVVTIDIDGSSSNSIGEEIVEIQFPSNPQQFLVSLEYTPVVKSCDDGYVDASQSSGPGSGVYGLKYDWDLVDLDYLNAVDDGDDPVFVDLVNDYIDSVFTDESYIEGGDLALADVDAIFALNLTSAVFPGGDYQEFTVRLVGNSSINEFLIVGGTSQYRLSYETNTLSMRNILTSCPNATTSQDTFFEWTQSEGPNITDLDSYLVLDGQFAQFPPFLFEVGATYEFDIKQLANLSTGGIIETPSNFLKVIIVETTPVIHIEGGTSVGLPNDESTFVVNASSSYDPTACEVLSHCNVLTYSWSCSMLSGGGWSACSNFTDPATSVFSIKPSYHGTNISQIRLTATLYSTSTGLQTVSDFDIYVGSSVASYDQDAALCIMPIPAKINNNEFYYLWGGPCSEVGEVAYDDSACPITLTLQDSESVIVDQFDSPFIQYDPSSLVQGSSYTLQFLIIMVKFTLFSFFIELLQLVTQKLPQLLLL